MSKKTEQNVPNQSSAAPEAKAQNDQQQPQAEQAEAADQLPEERQTVTTEGAEEAAEETAAEAELEQLRRQCEEAKDRALRYQAELDNFRKRMLRQMEQERRYASLPLIRDLLPVWDNMQRAVEAAEQNHEAASLLEGFKMVTRQLEDVLRRHHCLPIEALGQPFDPHRHEAIAQQATDDHPANTVLQVTRTGFMLHDRVVRPSQVIVSAPVPKQAGETGEKTSPTEHKQAGPEPPAADSQEAAEPESTEEEDSQE